MLLWVFCLEILRRNELSVSLLYLLISWATRVDIHLVVRGGCCRGGGGEVLVEGVCDALEDFGGHRVREVVNEALSLLHGHGELWIDGNSTW